MLVGPDAGGVHRDQAKQLPLIVTSLIPNRGEHPCVSPIGRPPPVTFPNRLVGTEFGRKITPWRPGPEPPDNTLQCLPMAVPRPTRPTRIRRKNTLKDSPQLIGDHIGTQHQPMLGGQITDS